MADVRCCRCQRLSAPGALAFVFRVEQVRVKQEGRTETIAYLPAQTICHPCAMADSEVLQAISTVEVREDQS